MPSPEKADLGGVRRKPGSGGMERAAHLMPLVYEELRRLAQARVARLGPGQTLSPTELVHESYLRISGGRDYDFEGRRHFFFAASRAMRDILVERVRHKASLKRGVASARDRAMKKGILRVIGTGIRTMGHLTIEAIAWMKAADKLLYLVGDPIGEDLILRLNPETQSLYGLNGEGKPRINTYNEMIDRVLTCVREGHRTCFALYGHPGVFVYPSHESVRRARAEGYDAQMLPGISAEDCLFADL